MQYKIYYKKIEEEIRVLHVDPREVTDEGFEQSIEGAHQWAKKVLNKSAVIHRDATVVGGTGISKYVVEEVEELPCDKHAKDAMGKMTTTIATAFDVDPGKVQIYHNEHANGQWLSVNEIAVTLNRVNGGVSSGIGITAEDSPELILWVERYINQYIDLTQQKPYLTAPANMLLETQLKVREALQRCPVSMEWLERIFEHKEAKKSGD